MSGCFPGMSKYKVMKIKCLAQAYNPAQPVGLEPMTSCSQASPLPTEIQCSATLVILSEIPPNVIISSLGAQWPSGRVLDSKPRGCGFKPHRRDYFVSLSKNINPSLVLVQPRTTYPFITEIFDGT